MSKKKWSAPLLIVVAKGRPEEALLAGCKHNATEGLSEGTFGGCQTWQWGPYSCALCSELVVS